MPPGSRSSCTPCHRLTEWTPAGVCSPLPYAPALVSSAVSPLFRLLCRLRLLSRLLPPLRGPLHELVQMRQGACCPEPAERCLMSCPAHLRRLCRCLHPKAPERSTRYSWLLMLASVHLQLHPHLSRLELLGEEECAGCFDPKMMICPQGTNRA